ncbi:hypothetical protein MRB53_007949 [Persea americana]|uniref:Uncharacterized protein n=1 Tax=Persea americana TaxID=3435 RepID=A0ACC2MKP7_PERAE|nr:hypothetical protein MRB53_007949 [Persea americana]
MLRAREISKLGTFLFSCFFMQVITSTVSQNVSSDCILSFKDYPYEPEGECLSSNEKIKQWGIINTYRCCRTALNAYSQALALHADQNDSAIFLTSDQWHKCELPVPDKNPISIDWCGFGDLHQDITPCSTFIKPTLAAQYPYQNLISKCSQFDHPSFDETCRQCTQEIDSTRNYLMGQLQINEDDQYNKPICGVALVILVAEAKIDNATWVSDFFRCLPASDIVDDNYFRISYTLAKALLAILILIFGLALVVVLIKYVTKKKKPARPPEGGVTTWSGLYRFSKAEIENAMSFSTHKVSLGAGSAGRVYKGVLPSGQLVAIKHIYKSSKADTFTREVDGLSRIRHPNLVCLFGCCVEDGEQYLVYEYCPYGNLAQHLLRSDSVLSWDKRVKILRDCALALRFLHSYPDGHIVHRDIKARK